MRPCSVCKDEKDFDLRAPEPLVCSECKRAQLKEWADKTRPSAERVNRNPYPKVCSMVGVHPDQAPEMRKFLAERGVDPAINSDGDFCPQSARHMRQYEKATGQVNRAGSKGQKWY